MTEIQSGLLQARFIHHNIMINYHLIMILFFGFSVNRAIAFIYYYLLMWQKLSRIKHEVECPVQKSLKNWVNGFTVFLLNLPGWNFL
ncbi:MAG: hypothetical protein PWP60_1255 [Candidatus Atribacteria bacterium]|jgi:hypothetical protein|nr:hypothetical protein [Candidatus Atribacteria bacterium]